MKAQRKILIVDDDPVVGSSFKRVLSGKGYLVVAAGNGAEALERIRSEHFDMVYTDLRMPGMDGFAVTESVRATQPWLPVVIVTGYGTDDNEVRARAAGASDFLRKPLSPEAIEQSAERALHAAHPDPIAERATPPPMPAPAAAAVEAPARGRGGLLKNMALFLSAPFVGLLYILLLPLVGLGMLAWVGARAVARQPGVQRVARFGLRTLQIVAAPLLGLVYVLVLPIAGLGLLAWTAVKAVAGRAPAA
jgi:CheY-like chemotaxis protein